MSRNEEKDRYVWRRTERWRAYEEKDINKIGKTEKCGGVGKEER